MIYCGTSTAVVVDGTRRKPHRSLVYNHNNSHSCIIALVTLSFMVFMILVVLYIYLQFVILL